VIRAGSRGRSVSDRPNIPPHQGYRTGARRQYGPGLGEGRQKRCAFKKVATYDVTITRRDDISQIDAKYRTGEK
jgi:hypothetical protein